MIKVLFVCHGNICRSPMAEFVFKDMLKKAGRMVQMIFVFCISYHLPLMVSMLKSLSHCEREKSNQRGY